MSESTISLSEEDLAELSLVIHEYVLEEVPSPAFLTAFIERETYIIADGIKWGFNDTVVRENVATNCAKFLIGKPWPTYGDMLTPEQFSKFEEDIKTAYASWNVENSKSTTA